MLAMMLTCGRYFPRSNTSRALGPHPLNTCSPHQELKRSRVDENDLKEVMPGDFHAELRLFSTQAAKAKPRDDAPPHTVSSPTAAAGAASSSPLPPPPAPALSGQPALTAQGHSTPSAGSSASRRRITPQPLPPPPAAAATAAAVPRVSPSPSGASAPQPSPAQLPCAPLPSSSAAPPASSSSPQNPGGDSTQPKATHAASAAASSGTAPAADVDEEAYKICRVAVGDTPSDRHPPSRPSPQLLQHCAQTSDPTPLLLPKTGNTLAPSDAGGAGGAAAAATTLTPAAAAAAAALAAALAAASAALAGNRGQLLAELTQELAGTQEALSEPRLLLNKMTAAATATAAAAAASSLALPEGETLATAPASIAPPASTLAALSQPLFSLSDATEVASFLEGRVEPLSALVALLAQACGAEPAAVRAVVSELASRKSYSAGKEGETRGWADTQWIGGPTRPARRVRQGAGLPSNGPACCSWMKAGSVMPSGSWTLPRPWNADASS